MGLGYSYVAGIDEVGRGPLAGPVMAGVVVFPPGLRGRWLRSVRDSKVLTAKQREDIVPRIRDTAIVAEVGSSSAAEVDEIGIVPATRLAIERALNSIPLLPQYLLLDALDLPAVNIPQKSIIGGDAKCVSIAAASIVAKVERDRLMAEADEQYPGYAFASNKGYGTAQHLRELRNRGPCEIHRFTFAPVRDFAAAR
ncbi:MAG: ribonuclease HII [Chloroflexi bacterium]|nr:ribonuclease HII [Chloroflexota bacterium]